MLIIRHTKGPLAGKEQRIDAKSDHITFGRDPSACEVVYPPDETVISRRHFAIVRRPSGEWTFDLFGDPYVGVNGEPADPIKAIHSGDKIELGKLGGPSFEIVFEGEGLPQGALPITAGGYHPPGAYTIADHAEKSASRARRFAAAAVVLALLAGGGAGGLWYWSRVDVARLTEASWRQQQEQAAQSISPTVRERLVRSAYLVLSRGPTGVVEGFASAVPIGPNILGTNAHVVQMFEKLKPGGGLFVRSPGADGKEYKVVSASKHPGFDAFDAFMRQDLFVHDRVLEPFPAYDVGVLHVEEGTKLDSIMELATREELADLKPGFPLAMAGYPSEAISISAIQSKGATPTFSVGVVTSMTDMFQLPGDAVRRHVVHHNLPNAGGASGSPMIGPNGKIYAFNNAGEMFRVPGQPWRYSSGAMQNYGQRVDLMYDLIENKANEAVSRDLAYWQERTAGLKRGSEVIVAETVRETTLALYREKNIPENSAPFLVSQQKFSLSAADRYETTNPTVDKSGAIVLEKVYKRQKMFPVKLVAGKPTLYIVYAENTPPIELWIYSGAEKLGSVEGRLTVSMRVAMRSDMSAEIYIISPDADVNATLYSYGWGPSAPPS